MTVPNSFNTKVYQLNGSATEFATEFLFFDDNEIEVLLVDGDVITPLVEGVDFSVSGAGEPGGGIITYPISGIGVDDGEMLIRRILPIVQETSLRNQGAYFPENVEIAFDKATMVDQQQQDQIDRSLMQSSGSVNYDANGNRIINVAAPVADGDAVNKLYVDESLSGALIAAEEATRQADYAEEWAQSPDAISVAAGGDGITDHSSKFWAQEAQATFETFDSASVLPSSQQFAVGAAVQSVDLGNINLSPNAIRVFIDGVYQFTSTWILTSGILSSADDSWPGDGVAENMEVLVDATVALSFNIPSNGSVNEDKLDPSFLASLQAGNVYDNIASAESAVYTAEPEGITVLGYYSVGDGGQALYIDPTTTNPNRTDSIQISVNGVDTWYVRQHNFDAVDLAQQGLLGDGSDETIELKAAVDLANTLGLDKVICRDRSKVFLIEGMLLDTDIEFDMGGAKLLGNFTEGGTTATIINATLSSTENLVFRNVVIDGGNSGNNPSGQGDTPPILVTGGKLVELDHVEFKNGANRGEDTFPSIFDYQLGEIQITNARRVYVHDSELGASPGEILTVQYSGANAFLATKLQVERCKFYKDRSHDPGTYWSSSSIVAYNVGKGSYIQDCEFRYHIKSAVNWFGPCVMERCTFEGVMDSQAADFDEAASFGIDQIVVKDCFFQNVIGGYAIRASGRQIVIDGVEINRCENGILIESAVATRPAYFTGVGVEGLRPLYNVWIRNVTSNGNDVLDGTGSAVTNTLIKLDGTNSSVPIFAHIEGTGVQLSADVPSANPEFGIHAINAFIYLKGAFQHGRTAMVFTEGLSNIVCRDCQFYPQAGATTHVIQTNNATVRDVLIEDCWVFGDLDPGFFHLTLSGSTTVSGAIYRNRSIDFSALNIGGATLLTNYV